MSIGGQNESEQKVYRLTPEGYAKNKERLEYLLKVKRKEIADYIHEAKEAGDISESSAYEDAKNEQAMVEGEIMKLERLLEVAEIMTAMDTDVVSVGMQVELTTQTGANRSFKIVETFEADPKTGLISNESPVGKALTGHKVGDVVEVSTPGGVTVYTIRAIRSIL
ncbi:MAG TPA: transcription elongation factor GreA [Ktedonobacteraceae bacterium]|jgi:transcription elongation factor GreA|nr:transcription elongation factor GreA [Ktedonobacteraceae bacterium]